MSSDNYKMPSDTPTPSHQVNDVTPEHDASFINGFHLINMNTTFIPMLFENLIPQVGVWAMVGASDTGKSMALRQIAMSVTGGVPFIGLQCNAIHKKVIIVCTEDDDFAISYLIRRQNKSIGLTDEQLVNVKFLFDTENLINKLQAELESNPVDLIIIDAFSDVFDGKDGNQNAQVRQFLNRFTQIAVKYKCSIGFLHHTGKRTEDLAPSKNNTIGSQGFEAKMRLVIELRIDKNNPDIRHFCVVKGNYLPQEYKSSSIVIRIDENLTFSNTGERVPYEQLNEGTLGRQKIEPSKIDNDIHLRCIRGIFPNGKQFSANVTNQKIRDYFSRLGNEFSEKIGRRFVDYYVANNWIVDVSEKPKYCSYKNNLPE